MTEGESTGRRKRRTEFSDEELSGLQSRDLSAEVRKLLEGRDPHEADQRARDVIFGLEETPYERWTPEVFFLSIEAYLAQARSRDALYFVRRESDRFGKPGLASSYREAIDTSHEFLELLNPDSEHVVFRTPVREAFPKAISTIEGSEKYKRTVAVRGFNLYVESLVIQWVLGSGSPDAEFPADIERLQGYLLERKDALVEQVGLTDKEQGLIDQRMTLVAMLEKAKHVVPEASEGLSDLLLKTLPHRGEYPEGFLAEIKDMLAERMQPVVAAGNELQDLRV